MLNNTVGVRFIPPASTFRTRSNVRFAPDKVDIHQVLLRTIVGSIFASITGSIYRAFPVLSEIFVSRVITSLASRRDASKSYI